LLTAIDTKVVVAGRINAWNSADGEPDRWDDEWYYGMQQSLVHLCNDEFLERASVPYPLRSKAGRLTFYWKGLAAFVETLYQ